MQEERKRDVEETAEFIKQIISTGKQDWQREIQRVENQLEKLKITCSGDLTEVHAKLIAMVE